jgi:hypothetical protein
MEGIVYSPGDIPVSNYRDLGLIIDATNVPAGAYAYSNYFDNMQWVRSFAAMVGSDQSYSVHLYIRDTAGTTHGDSTLNSVVGNQSATGGPTNLRQHRVGQLGTVPGFLGYSARFAVKNDGSAAAAIKVRMQLLGL